MLGYKTTHHLMQKIDDKWIEEAVYAERKNTVFRKFAAAAAILLICTLISTGVAAAISPTVREWLLEQFQGKKPVIEKVILPGGITEVKDGFFIQDINDEMKVYVVEDGELILCETNTFHSYVMFQDKRYDFSFDYVRNGKSIYAWNYQGATVDVTGYDENTGIAWLWIENIWNCYYIDYLAENDPVPVVDPEGFENLWSKHYYWNDNGEKTEGYVKLSMDMQVSSDGNWLLYRSNRNCLTTESGEYNIDAKGEWIVQNTKTGEEDVLYLAPSYLHNSEIGFVANDVISILYTEQTDNEPVLYDCQSQQFVKLERLSVNSSLYSIHFEMTEIEKEYRFRNFYTNETYAIPKSKNEKIRASYVDENLICILETDGTVKTYLISYETVLDFGRGSFKDMDAIHMVFSLGDEQFLIVGEEHGKVVGYLVVRKA